MPKLSFDYAKLCVDVRFRALVKRVGSHGEALDRLLRFWDLALTQWGKGRALLPEATFELDPELAVLIDVRLAERRADGIYARGAEEHFDWYARRLDAASKAGRASAAARKERDGSAQPSPNQTFDGRSEIAEPNDHQTTTKSKPSSSTSSSALQTITPPTVPQTEDHPRISRSEQRGLDRVAAERKEAASNYAAAVFACAATVSDPLGEYSVSAYATLDPQARKLIGALYPGGDGWAHLVRAIARHRQTRSPEAKFAQYLRESFASLVVAKPELLSDHSGALAPTKPVSTHQEASP